jgi:hypothetical protein
MRILMWCLLVTLAASFGCAQATSRPATNEKMDSKAAKQQKNEGRTVSDSLPP